MSEEDKFARDVFQYITSLVERNKKLEAWIDDLQSGMYINCVYCGFRYGPEDETDTTMRKALHDHIAVCELHPLSMAEATIKELDKFVGFSEYLWGLLDDISTAGDMFKPEIDGYFKYVNRKCEERNKVANSPDGFALVWNGPEILDIIKQDSLI